jgi:hypothetical protein
MHRDYDRQSVERRRPVRCPSRVRAIALPQPVKLDHEMVFGAMLLAALVTLWTLARLL